jgi:glycosyltransferase involved in cell wall biosynthesis
MRILWVKAGKLFPVDAGGRIRTVNILRHLAARNEVTVFSYYQGARDRFYEQELAKHFPRNIFLATGGPGNGSPRSLRTLHYVSKALQAAPYAVSQFDSRAVRLALREQFDSNRFDVAVCDFMAATLNFPTGLPTPSVLFQHNVEAALWRRQAHTGEGLLARLAFALESTKMNRYEPKTIAKFDHVVAVSEYDRKLMAEVPDERISVVPTGVDFEKFAAREPHAGNDPIVIFTGAMDWEANIDGIRFFCREIWPTVLSEVPQAKLQVVGREPDPRVKSLASISVQVTGTVPSILEYLRAAAVVIVPLRVGGGTRLKIYEAMAMGKAIVSTSIGAEGLDVHTDRDILIADAPLRFARQVIDLLKDENLRLQYGREAVKTASQYDWKLVATRFEHILAEVASRGAHDTRAALEP